jgi:segregation and condensation protein B
MRGVRSEEVVAHLHDLAEHYRQQGRPYTIVDGPDGHRLVLSSRFSRVAEKLFGTTEREVRLSRAAIDVLAAVAYRQPISRHEIDQLRGANSGAVLRQLVRRELLRISRSHDNPRDVSYHTTDRFLGVFGLASLDELPQSEDLEAPRGATSRSSSPKVRQATLTPTPLPLGERLSWLSKFFCWF